MWFDCRILCTNSLFYHAQTKFRKKFDKKKRNDRCRCDCVMIILPFHRNSFAFPTRSSQWCDWYPNFWCKYVQWVHMQLYDIALPPPFNRIITSYTTFMFITLFSQYTKKHEHGPQTWVNTDGIMRLLIVSDSYVCVSTIRMHVRQWIDVWWCDMVVWCVFGYCVLLCHDCNVSISFNIRRVRNPTAESSSADSNWLLTKQKHSRNSHEHIRTGQCTNNTDKGSSAHPLLPVCTHDDTGGRTCRTCVWVCWYDGCVSLECMLHRWCVRAGMCVCVRARYLRLAQCARWLEMAQRTTRPVSRYACRHVADTSLRVCLARMTLKNDGRDQADCGGAGLAVGEPRKPSVLPVRVPWCAVHRSAPSNRECVDRHISFVSASFGEWCINASGRNRTTKRSFHSRFFRPFHA